MNSSPPFNIPSTNPENAIEDIKTITLYSHSKDNDVLAYLRFLGPAAKLGIKIINGMENDRIYVERASEGDIVVLQRDFPLHLLEYEQILSLARREKKPVILDLDDLLLALPEDHPDRKNHYYARALLPILQALLEVDLVTVSNTRLRDLVLPFNTNVVVLPNYFNDDLWRFREPSGVSAQEETVVVGYMGGASHQSDLEMILPVLFELKNRYPTKLQFDFWGIRPPTQLASFSQVYWHLPNARNYPEFAAFFQTQTADIFIGPLKNNVFNSCKSPIKYFEYTALGAPGVFSRIEPYTDVITHEQDGLLASSLEEWSDCLIRLIEEPKLRLTIATNAQKTIQAKWLLSRNTQLWREAFKTAFINLDSKNAEKTALQSVVRSLSHQIKDEQDYKNRQINILSSQIRAFGPLIAELGALVPYIKFKIHLATLKNLALIRSSGLFDENWYLAQNPDVAQAQINPLFHYYHHGGFEGRDPGPYFSSRWYLDTYEDVKTSGINPLVHFLKYGVLKGHKSHPNQTDLPLTSQKIFRYQHPIRATLIPLGSRRERLLLDLKKASFFNNMFNKTRMARIGYVLKNYGLGALIKAIIRKVIGMFRTKGMFSSQITSSQNYGVISWIKARTGEIKTKRAQAVARRGLQDFLKSDGRLVLPVVEQPLVSIILLFRNRAEMSLQCLKTLEPGAGKIPFEVVIVDNASTDETSELLDRVQNAKVVRNVANAGFGGGCNQAVDLAVGKYLFFLNNDTQLLPNALQVMVETLEGENNIGVVGGKLIFPDGRLQEAGSIIWQDGSCTGYGRHDQPFKPEYSFVRDVDFCSGALFLTPRELFLSLGKFDSRYAPAYYEDADYCLSVWNAGQRVVFQPLAVAVHHEYGSSGSEGAIALMQQNHKKFVEKWQSVLTHFDPPVPDCLVFSRTHKSEAKRILFIDDRIPDYRLGAGFPRTYRMLQMLAEMGYHVTFLPLQTSMLVPEIAQSLQTQGIEVLYKPIQRKVDAKAIADDPTWKFDLEGFLRSRPNYYDIALVSRPHNMQQSIQLLQTHSRSTAIVYDAEALFALRDIKFMELNNQHLPEAEREQLIRSEVALVKDAQVVTTVSPLEKDIFTKHGASNVHVLGHIIEPSPTPAPFEERQDILFVGGILSDPSPNADAVRYFIQRILPLVHQTLPCNLFIVGMNRVPAIQQLASEHIHVIGQVDDLTSYYNRSRLFVVPTRYSAGIPLKLLEAAAHGLPAVVTPLTAIQLGWQENRDLLVGHNPADFAQKVVQLYSDRTLFYTLRQNALERIQEEFSPQNFQSTLHLILTSTSQARQRC